LLESQFLQEESLRPSFAKEFNDMNYNANAMLCYGLFFNFDLLHIPARTTQRIQMNSNEIQMHSNHSVFPISFEQRSSLQEELVAKREGSKMGGHFLGKCGGNYVHRPYKFTYFGYLYFSIVQNLHTILRVQI
jgi:hypothetical protein